MDVAEKTTDLLKLGIIWSENLRRARKVVNYGDGEDLNRHLLLDFAAGTLFLVGFVELGDRVVVLVSVLPPLRTELAHVAERVFLQVVGKRR